MIANKLIMSIYNEKRFNHAKWFDEFPEDNLRKIIGHPKRNK